MTDIQRVPTMVTSNADPASNTNSGHNPFNDSFLHEENVPDIKPSPNNVLPVFPDEPPSSSSQPTTLNGTTDAAAAAAADREQRAKRLKEEAVRRLVSDVNRTATITVNPLAPTAVSGTSSSSPDDTNLSHHGTNRSTDPTTNGTNTTGVGVNDSSNLTFEQQARQQDELLVASTIATAIERNLDRELHHELTKQMKESAASISKICHEHSDSFLHSVGKVVALGEPCQRVRIHIDQANDALQQQTGEPMLRAAMQLEYMKEVVARAKTVHGIVTACREVATLLERARKQATLARPRTALDAVDEARSCLTASLSSLVHGNGIGSGGGGNSHGGNEIFEMEDMKVYFDALLTENEIAASTGKSNNDGNGNGKNNSSKLGKRSLDRKDSKAKMDTSTRSITDVNTVTSPSSTAAAGTDEIEKNELRLDDTPFGARAMSMLPKIENEVLMGARRGLNKWFLSIRSGGDGAKAGRAALRKCAHSLAVGPGQLGLGGDVKGYQWRAKNADNLISRVSQNGKLARAIRMGYWFQRDNKKDVERLERISRFGMERRAEAFASAFGWYRCWEEDDPLEVEEIRPEGSDDGGLNRSGHALSRTGHSLKRSNHGASSRQGLSSMSYRPASRRDRDSSLTYRTGVALATGKKPPSQWSIALTPSVLFDDAPSKADDEKKLAQIPDSVYPVRRAEAAFALQGKTEEFRQYYEQNRFGDMKIGEKTDEDGYERETRSSLSSLTGDDVSQGSDRMFFARGLPHFSTSVVGFSAIEAALELGNYQYEENGDRVKVKNDVSAGGVDEPVTMSFRESSARYERKLISELGSLLRSRAIGATLVELSRASCLMAAFRSALKIVHPGSTTRNTDKELIAMDVDILMTGLKVAQEEQRRATSRIIHEDNKEPMLVNLEKSSFRYNRDDSTNSTPAEEYRGFPFGLAEQKQNLNIDKAINELDGGISRSGGIYRSYDEKEYYKFSQSVPLIVRAIHSRAIAFAAFASSQEGLGQVFTSKKGGGISGYVLDCLEQLIVIAAVGMKDNNGRAITSVQEAVQIMANITVLKAVLPRLIGTIMRGLFHLGMAKGDQLEESFEYAESTLTKTDEYCDNQTKSIFNTLYNICQSKIDELLRFSLENFQWVSRSARDSPNTYCESLIDYLRTIFKCLKTLDEGPKAMLYFSTCGHITERMVHLIAGKIEDTDKKGKTNTLLSPIVKIDAFGIKNLSLDVQALELFADGTGLPQLRNCFNELRWVTDALLDPDLPMLLNPENENARRRKHPFLQLDLIANVLEKYQGSGGIGNKLLGASGTAEKFLILEKKEITQLLRVVKAQIKKG